MDSFKPDSFEPDAQADSFHADSFDAEAPRYRTRDMIGDVARPILEGGGAVAGGVVGAPLGPVGAAGGGALGFGIGKSAADLLDRGLGRKAPIQTVTEAAGEAGRNLYEGAKVEATGQVASKVVPPVLKALGRGRNLAGEWATGVPGEDFATVAEHPMSMRPGALRKAGDAFGQAEKNAGISSELTPEAVDRIRNPGQYAFDTFNKLQTTGKITPQEALHARQSLDAVYPIPNQKNGAYIRMLDGIRDAFQNVIANTTPELKAASRDYAIAKSGSKFQAILPQNKSGTPSFFRGGAMISGLLAGQPMAAFMSPGLAGTATALTGAAGKATNRILKSPNSRRLLFGTAGSRFTAQPGPQAGVVNPSNGVPQSLDARANDGKAKQNAENLTSDIGNQVVPPKRLLKSKPEKVLTEAEAKNYLRKAKGDRSSARRMAIADGWTIPS